jgi:hypothetical protein
MAVNIPIVTEFIDKGLKSAQGAFATFRQKVGEAEGGMGKFKAGAGAAFDSVKANAGAMALGAGTAIAGFAIKAIGDFQDLALSVDKFRNTTGLTLDQSSQWVSYTGDLGIQAESMVKIFNRLGKAATDQLPAFKELGVEIAFGPDGAADLEKTFLRVNDAINSLEDPVKQAKYRADLFGRGWMDAAELINMSSDEITTALAGVKDFEVIDEKEIQKAKDLREAQDELGDAFARLSVSLGEALIPALTALSKILIPVLEALAKFNGTLDSGMAEAIAKAQEMGHSLSDIARELGANSEQSLRYMADVLGISLDQLYQQLDRDLVPETYLLEKAWKEGSRAMIDARNSGNDLRDALVTVDDALAELTGNIDERRTFRKLQDSIERAEDAALRAFTESTPAALRASDAAIDDLRMTVAEYIYDIEGVPVEWQTKFIAALDEASVADVERILAELGRAREIPFMPSLPPGVGGIGEIGSGGRPIGEAPIGFGIPSLSGVGMRSGVTVNVAGSVISQNDLVETVRKGLVNSQRNGAGLVYSNR